MNYIKTGLLKLMPYAGWASVALATHGDEVTAIGNAVGLSPSVSQAIATILGAALLHFSKSPVTQAHLNAEQPKS